MAGSPELHPPQLGVLGRHLDGRLGERVVIGVESDILGARYLNGELLEDAEQVPEGEPGVADDALYLVELNEVRAVQHVGPEAARHGKVLAGELDALVELAG